MISWVTWCYCLVVVKLSLCSVLATDTSCPNWNYYNNATGQCECGYRLLCTSDGNQVDIRIQRCATSSGQEDDYYVSYCPFTRTVNSTNRKYSEMPSNASQLDEVMCGPYNRRGLLCGECKDGYGPAVYSFDMTCANCSSLWSRYAISLYLFLQFVPTTLIFLCFVVFRFNITSGPLLGYVVFCQTTIAGINHHYSFIYDYIQHHVSSFLRVLLDMSLTVSQFWSLQFLKAIIPPFCISEKLTGIHVNMLNLVPAIYPLVLVIISCILMELHARNYRIVGILWKPFKMILSKANITAVTSDAVFHAFASFIFLSNISVMFTAYEVVNFVIIWNSTGHFQKKVLYTDPTVEWNTSVPYALIAAVIFIFISLIPSLLLCIYPTRLYRYLSRFLSARKRLAITAFAEALHSCFKDGLNGTRDYRAFAGATLFLNVLVVAINYFLVRLYRVDVSYHIAELVLWMILACIVSYVKPCKSAVANISLSFHLTMVGILICFTYLWDSDLSVETYTLELMSIVTLLSPHILVAVWAGYTLTKHTLTRFGYQFHGPGCKAALSDMANGVRLCLCRRHRGYQELLPHWDINITFRYITWELLNNRHIFCARTKFPSLLLFCTCVVYTFFLYYS